MSSAVEQWPGSDRRLPYGPISLWDMINCHIASLCSLSSQLMLYQIVLGERPANSDGPHDPADKGLLQNVLGWLQVANAVADDFELEAVRDRVSVIKKRISKKKLTNADISTEMRVLLETVAAGLKGQLVYRYPSEKGIILFNWKEDWAAVAGSFPSAEKAILAGVDLWALGHSTASVFQFMRVLEHGLRALAKDVGKTFDIQNWQNIIAEIESEIRSLREMLPRGSEKNDRLQFLSEAAKEFFYFKDGWRNYVSHNKATYDEREARSVLEHVKSFMTVLSSRLNEQDHA